MHESKSLNKKVFCVILAWKLTQVSYDTMLEFSLLTSIIYLPLALWNNTRVVRQRCEKGVFRRWTTIFVHCMRFSWLRVNAGCLSSNEQYDLTYLYPQIQPPTCEVYSMYCSMCSQHLQSSSANDISKKSGSRMFKMETLKKHDKSQAHASCVESLKACQKPQERPFVKSLNKLIGAKDPKLEKILTVFTL